MKKSHAFTLIELLLSMAILALLLAFIGQMVGNTQIIAANAGRRSDADGEARLIFNRMAIDFNAIAKLPDVNCRFHHQTAGSASAGANDSLYFYSEATGYLASGDPAGTGSSVRDTFSLVGYRVSDQISNNSRFQLERLGRGLHWSGALASGTGNAIGVLCLPQTIASSFASAISDAYNNSSNLRIPANPQYPPEWDVISDEVYRLEFCFQLKDGTLSDIPVSRSNGLTNNLTASAPPTASNDSTGGYSSGSRWFDSTAEIGYICSSSAAGAAVWKPLGLQDVEAVVVAIAALDNRSRVVANTGTLTNLVSAFQDFSITNIDPVTNKPLLMGKAWLQALNGSSFISTTGLAPGLLPGVRIYERYFYVN